MDERDKHNVEGLKETLKSAAAAGTNVHIGSKDAGEYAESLQKVLDASEKVEVKMERGVIYGGIVIKDKD